MNVKDVPSPPMTDLDPVRVAGAIMERQKELESKYWVIESRHAPQVDINSAKGQALIKDFLWRATEEIGEAFEFPPSRDYDKYHEEMADGLHFVAGLCHIVNRPGALIKAFDDYYGTKGDDENWPQTHYIRVHRFVVAAGCLGNTLKLKPWKQSAILTDSGEFEKRLDSYLYSYLEVWAAPLATVYDYYWRKSEVNLFRIRSKY